MGIDAQTGCMALASSGSVAMGAESQGHHIWPTWGQMVRPRNSIEVVEPRDHGRWGRMKVVLVVASHVGESGCVGGMLWVYWEM